MMLSNGNYLPYVSLDRDNITALTTAAQYAALDDNCTLITIEQTAGTDEILCRFCTDSTTPSASDYDFTIHANKKTITKQEIEKFSTKWYTRLWLIAASGSGNAVRVIQY